MAKELKELKIFNSGTVTSPDVKDVGDEAASYSLNLDTVSSDGKLMAIPQDAEYRLDGTFKDATEAHIIDSEAHHQDAHAGSGTLRMSTIVHYNTTYTNSKKDYSYHRASGVIPAAGSYDYIQDMDAGGGATEPINFWTGLFGDDVEGIPQTSDLLPVTVYMYTNANTTDPIIFTEGVGYPVPIASAGGSPYTSFPYVGTFGESIDPEVTDAVPIISAPVDEVFGQQAGTGKVTPLLLVDIVSAGGGTYNQMRFSIGGAPTIVDEDTNTDFDTNGVWQSKFSYFGQPYLTSSGNFSWDSGTGVGNGGAFENDPVVDTEIDLGGNEGIQNKAGDKYFNALFTINPIADLNLSDTTMVDEERTVPEGEEASYYTKRGLTAGAKTIVKNIVGLDKSTPDDNQIVLIEDFYGKLSDPVIHSGIPVGSGSSSITSEAFNKQVHIGLGNHPGTNAKWVGRTTPKQLSASSGWVVANAHPKPLENESNTCVLDKMVTCQTHDITGLGKVSFGIVEGSSYLYVINTDDSDTAERGQMKRSPNLGHNVNSICEAKFDHGITDEADGTMLWVLDGTNETVYLYNVGLADDGAWGSFDEWNDKLPKRLGTYIIKKGYDFYHWETYDNTDEMQIGPQQTSPADATAQDILEVATTTKRVLWILYRKNDGSEFIEDERFLWCANITSGDKQSDGQAVLDTDGNGTVVFYDRTMPMSKCNTMQWTGRMKFVISFNGGWEERGHQTMFFDDDLFYRAVFERKSYTRIGQKHNPHMWEGMHWCLASSDNHGHAVAKLRSVWRAQGDDANLGTGLGWYPDVAISVTKYSLVEIHKSDDQAGAVGCVLHSAHSFVTYGGEVRNRTFVPPDNRWAAIYPGKLEPLTDSFLYTSIGLGTGFFDSSWDNIGGGLHYGETKTDDSGYFNISSGGCHKRYATHYSHFEDDQSQFSLHADWDDYENGNEFNAGGNSPSPESTDTNVEFIDRFFFSGLQCSEVSGIIKGIYNLESTGNNNWEVVEQAISVNPSDAVGGDGGDECHTLILTSVLGNDYEQTRWDAYDLGTALDFANTDPFSVDNAVGRREGILTIDKARNWRHTSGSNTGDYIDTTEGDETLGCGILGWIEDDPTLTTSFTTKASSYFTSSKYGRYRNGRAIISWDNTEPTSNDHSFWDFSGSGPASQFGLLQDDDSLFVDEWSEQDSSLVISDGPEGDIFDVENVYRYKLSVTYDGHQESPLSQSTWRYETDVKRNSVNITVNLRTDANEDEVKRWSRITHVTVYRADTERDYYIHVETLATDKGWSTKTINSVEVKSRSFIDSHGAGSSYEALTGISETMTNFKLNYALSTQVNSIHVVGRCHHPDIKDFIENYLFFSKPFKFDTFDWSSTGDFIQLPNIPTAMAAFNGRLYVWDTNNTYRIDPTNMTIEDVFEGIGCINNKVVVTTEFGMFFADNNNIYTHDGTLPSAIGEGIARGDSTFAWVNRDKSWGNEYAGWDSRRNSYVLIFRVDEAGTYRYYAWAYNVARTRWDMWDIGYDEITAIMAGKDGEILLSKLDLASEGNETRTGHMTQYLTSPTLKRNWEFDSKEQTMDYDTQDKVLYNIRSTGDYIGNTAYTSGAYNGEYPLTAFIDGSSVNLLIDTDSNYTKIPSANKKGKKIKISLRADNQGAEGDDKKVDSIGIVYRRRAVR